MTARTQLGRCSSGKVRYRNRRAADAGRDVVRQQHEKTGIRTSDELFIYRCRICSGWHLTKRPPPPPVPDPPETPPITG